MAARLAALGQSAEPPVLLEVIVALGRLHWPQTPAWLRENLKAPDAALAHAAMQALRRSENWPVVLTLLDQPDSASIRAIALRAIAGQAKADIVEGLRQRLQTDSNPLRRREYADVLARIHRLPGPWVYWGYRPAPRPPNTVAWTHTAAIEEALDRVLGDADRDVRTATLRQMQREQIPVRLGTLDRWLRFERDGVSVAAMVDSLRDRPGESVRELFDSVLRDRTYGASNRLAVLEIFLRGPEASSRLLGLAGTLDDGPVLAEVLRQMGMRPELSSRPLLRSKLSSPAPEVRAAALESVAALEDRDAAGPVVELLQDPEARVRQAAALAAGRLTISKAVEPLLRLAGDPDPLVRRESLDSLRRLREPRVVPLAKEALADGPCQLVALECLADLGGPAQLEAVTRVVGKNQSLDLLQAVVRALTGWQQKELATSPNLLRLDEAVAGVQGNSGLLLRWQVTGPVPGGETDRVRQALSQPRKASGDSPGAVPWQTHFTAGPEARVDLRSPGTADTNSVWLGVTEAVLAEPSDVQFLGSSTGAFRVWLNGRMIHQRARPGLFRPDSDRFDARLDQGRNSLIVEVQAQRDVRFHLRFRRKSSDTGREQLTQLALATPGNAVRGRQVFFDTGKSQCLTCHRFGDQGGRVGPELTGAGARFSRIHLIESILEPSRTIAQNFEGLVVELKDGRVLSGVKTAETRETLTLGDQQGQHELRKTEIGSMQPLALSAMPEGLEKALTREEFVNLIAFLLEQK
jgi:putative heme-binding domain-containing protein